MNTPSTPASSRDAVASSRLRARELAAALMHELDDDVAAPKAGATIPAIAATRAAARPVSFNVDVTFVAESKVGLRNGVGPQAGCRPRAGAVRRDQDFLAWLPKSLVAKMRGHEAHVLKWLAASEENATLFLAHPAEALRKSGVPLERSELRQIGLVRSRDGAAAGPPMLALGAIRARADVAGAKASASVVEARPADSIVALKDALRQAGDAGASTSKPHPKGDCGCH